jgi:hypothetical protein
MTYHKLIKVVRFSKSFKPCPRFIRKRMFKNFDPEKLRESQLDEILTCTDVNQAAELLVHKMNTILDIIAPIKTVQIRTHYVP